MFSQGLSSALPFVLVTTTLQSWYIASGIQLAQLGWLALIVQAYLFKFLWAHYCDSNILFGKHRRKSWIFTTQILLIALILIMGKLNPNSTPMVLACVAFITAIISATQDISIDAYRSELSEHFSKQESIIGILYISGFRLGYLIAGAGGLIIAQFYNWQYTYNLMALIMFFNCLMTIFFFKEIPKKFPVTFSKIKVFKELVSKCNFRMIFMFIFLFEFGDSLVNSIFTAFLYEVKKYDLTQIAFLLKTTNIIAMCISPIFAFIFLKKISLLKTMIIGLFGEMFLLALLGLLNNSMTQLFWIQIGLGLSEGLLGVLIVIFYTNLAQGSNAAFSYSILAALGGVKILITPAIAIFIALQFSWNNLFFIASLTTIPSLLIGYHLDKPKMIPQ